ncbi:dipeptidase PepE [Dysgonomonas capnocytophagoides]|uniref:dipeptidase E n=1 Tax=Dysgonomonas capnocytophagoides TaxID=45254 RepID=A0A4Y8KX87_9BACT|nr:dipeptidase PepE [Dysgonomonas capnocytophagoides]TFD94251.1 dipeptidase PepE [Dysgonomonas capnocytophagoides]
MRLLLLSNSTNPGESYLGYPKQTIKSFLGDKPLNIVFVPYAAVTFSYDEYAAKVNGSLNEVGLTVKGTHTFDNPQDAIRNADAIMVGGGNTWKLTRTLQDNGLIDLIREKVQKGTPYIGWSAGSNVACPTLRTTNDMPIIVPLSFETFNLVPFQINPHYLDDNPSNHGGETREMRIAEFIIQNPDIYVVGLRESTILHFEDGKLSLIGERSARIFKHGTETVELTSKDDFNFLLKS